MERELQGMMKRGTSKDQKWNTNLETTKEEESIQTTPEPLYPGESVWAPYRHQQLCCQRQFAPERVRQSTKSGIRAPCWGPGRRARSAGGVSGPRGRRNCLQICSHAVTVLNINKIRLSFQWEEESICVRARGGLSDTSCSWIVPGWM